MALLKQERERQQAQPVRMKMRYGLNEADEWFQFALGLRREEIWDRFREIDTRMIRVFLFDKGGPDPVEEWPVFRNYVQAVLNVGAVPMVTFAKFRRPLDDPRAIRWFATQCGDVVWNSLEEWGPDEVANWYWCVWNEPNSDWIGGGLSFEQYRRIYEAVAREILQWLAPHLLPGQRPRIGGPSVEGFQPFWMDWVWRFVHEIDNGLIGFVDWHCYGDWRDDGEAGAPPDPSAHRAMMMSQVGDFEARGSAIGRLLRGRNIENICGELNTHSHYWDDVRARFNQSVFGGTFYAAALLRLMRAGVDTEMFWTGTDEKGGYGMMGHAGQPMPAFHVKRLCAQHVRYRDLLWFPDPAGDHLDIDYVLACGEDGRRRAIVVHLEDGPRSYDLARLDPRLADLTVAVKIDEGTGNEVVERRCDGVLSFDGFGVAGLTDGGGVSP